jgi:hypothetical protein
MRGSGAGQEPLVTAAYPCASITGGADAEWARHRVDRANGSREPQVNDPVGRDTDRGIAERCVDQGELVEESEPATHHDRYQVHAYLIEQAELKTLSGDRRRPARSPSTLPQIAERAKADVHRAVETAAFPRSIDSRT